MEEVWEDILRTRERDSEEVGAGNERDKGNKETDGLAKPIKVAIASGIHL